MCAGLSTAVLLQLWLAAPSLALTNWFNGLFRQRRCARQIIKRFDKGNFRFEKDYRDESFKPNFIFGKSISRQIL
jgi:hypothetical protein